MSLRVMRWRLTWWICGGVDLRLTKSGSETTFFDLLTSIDDLVRVVNAEVFSGALRGPSVGRNEFIGDHGVMG